MRSTGGAAPAQIAAVRARASQSPALGHRVEQRRLVAEMRIERRVADAHLAGDLGQPQFDEAVLADPRDGDLDGALARILRAETCSGHVAPP